MLNRILLIALIVFQCSLQAQEQKQTYPIVDTGLSEFYSASAIIKESKPNDEFYGQDAHYMGNKPSYTNNGDGTISDLSTGLMWQKTDDGTSRDWSTSLTYAENLTLGGKSDWRLPNAKELQSIVDYMRSLQTTNSPAINPIFETSQIKDPGGNINYPFFWSSTTHKDGVNPYGSAVYVAFGEGQGKMRNKLMDVHGAGCQRSDPKSGNRDDYPQFFGPQGDVRYVYNYVRCVRTIN